MVIKMATDRKSRTILVGTMILRNEVPLIKKRAEMLGYSTAGEYMRALIRNDVRQVVNPRGK
jgi:hypothetical protein